MPWRRACTDHPSLPPAAGGGRLRKKSRPFAAGRWRKTALLAGGLLLCLPSASLQAWFPQADEESFLHEQTPAPLVGTAATSAIAEGETLTHIARASGVGYEGLLRANPGVDPWLPDTGKQLLLPYSGIVPGPLTPGITVNLAEMRLYHLFRDNGRLRVRIYPVGIGVEGADTPEGEFTIRNKIEKPTWVVPASVRREKPDLPATVPPGPDNPLGEYWLGLSRSGYGIHGTSEPFGVGRRVSRGCLRLYPEDIRDLYRRVQIGTPVRIVYRPIKVGLKRGALFIESHADFAGRLADPLQEVERQLMELKWRGGIDWEEVMNGIREARGLPRLISAREDGG